MTFRHLDTGRRLFINTYDFRPSDPNREPTTREMNAAIRIVYNSKNGDILLMIPKLRDGQTLHFGRHEGALFGLFRQLRENRPAIDPRDAEAPERLIWFLRNPEAPPPH